jgi:uncharacterized protein (TIGR02301 family)
MIGGLDRHPMFALPIPRTLAAAILAAMVSLGAARAAEQPTPYDPDLLRLSEILGALSYLEKLCESPQSPLWRDRMEALIKAQRMSEDDRRRYVDVFNRGFRTFAAVHRTCSDQTRFVISTYFEEGTRITARLEERFGRGPAATALPGN